MARKNKINFFKIFLLSGIMLLATKAFADCTSPAAVAGTREWFSADKKLKYCNGTSWVGLHHGGLKNVATITDPVGNNFVNANTVVVSAGYAYTVGPQKFTIVNLTTPKNPQYVKTMTHSNFGSYLAVSGNYAYISGTNMITVVDISNKSNPTVVGSITDATNLPSISAMMISGSYLYVLATSRLTVVNISTPTSPTIEGSVVDATKFASGKGLDITGNYVVTAASTYDGIAVVDVTTKSAPTIVGSYTDATKMDNISALKIYGNYVFTAGTNSDTLGVIDITTKTAPTWVLGMTSVNNFDGVRSLAIKNDRLYVGSSPGSSSNNNMVSLDISNPVSPVVATQNDQGYNYNPYSLSLDNNTLVGLSNNGGRVLLVFDITSRLTFKKQESIYIRRAATSLADVAVSGTLGVAIDSNEVMYTFDVTNPVSIVAKGTVYMPGYTNRYSQGVAFDGSYAYVSEVNSQRVFVVDVASDPDYPQIVGTVTSGSLGQAYGIEVDGNYVYVIRSGGLTIVDVTNKTNPTVVGTVAITGTLRYLKVSGNYVFVPEATGTKLTIVDVTNKASPTIVGNVVDATALAGAADLDVSGNYAYVAATNRLTAVDISTVSAPVIAGSLLDTTNLVNAKRVKISGSTAYVLGSRFSAVSITSPASPTFQSYVTSDGYSALDISGGYLYTGTGTGFRSYTVAAPPVLQNFSQGLNQIGTAGGISGVGNYAYVTSNGKFLSIDISVPTRPAVVSILTDATKLNAAQRNVVSGTRVFTIGSGYITAVSVNTPTSPTISGYLADATNLASAKTIRVSGNYAFVGGNKLSVVDISGANPVHVTSLTHALISSCNDMEMQGNYLYMTCGVTNSFIVVNISTPTAPTIAGTYTSSTYITTGMLTDSMVIVNNIAYIARGVYNMLMLDVSNPASPGFAGVSSSSSNCTALANTGDLNRIFCNSNGNMLALDLSDPLQPTSLYSALLDGYVEESVIVGNRLLSFVQGGINVGSTQLLSLLGLSSRFGGDTVLSSVRGVDIVGNYAYFSTANRYLNIFDISNVASATLVSSTFIGDSQYFYMAPYDITVSGNYAYIPGSTMYGTAIFDISNPAAPKKVASIQKFSELYNTQYMKVEGNYLYGTGMSGGFMIYNVASATTPVAMDGIIDSTYLSSPHGFAIFGNNAFTCASSNSRITNIDISNKSLLAISNSLQDTVKFAGCRHVELAASNNYAYMLGTTNGYFNVIDVTNPASMTLAGSLQSAASFGGTIYDVAVSGTSVVVVNNNLMTLVDVSVASAPKIIDTLSVQNTTHYFTKLVGNKLFTADFGLNSSSVFDIVPPLTMEACTTSGSMQYDTVNNVMKFCTGTNNLAMSAFGGIAGAGCATPSGKPGALDYNSVSNVYRYCDGTNWIQVGQ